MRDKDFNMHLIAYVAVTIVVIISVVINSIWPLVIMFIVAIGGWFPIMLIYYNIKDKREAERWERLENEERRQKRHQ